MQQRQPSGLGSERNDRDVPHPLGKSGSARLPRRPGATVTALTLGSLALGGLGYGAMRAAPAGTTDLLDGFSATWSRMLTAVQPHAVPGRAISASGPQPGMTPAPPARPAPPGQNAIAYGDRLKVTFFESVGVALGDAASKFGDPAVNAVFPRMDLSGEYVVDEAGEVDIPRLGRAAAAGEGISALEAKLADSFRRALGRPGDVHIAWLERQPIYVLGGPRGGTAIKYASGMIALQALAEAGGYQSDASDTSRAIEAIRETQRLGETEDRLARALVRQAQLIAVRDGLSSVALPPATAARLAEMLPQDAVAAMLREADTTLDLERRAHADQVALADRLVGIAQREIAAQNLRTTQAQAITQNKATRLRDLQGIAMRGSISQFKLTDTAAEVAEAAAKQEDNFVTLTQAESRLAEAEIARAKIVQAHTAQVTLDIAAADRDVGDLTRVAASMQAVVAVLGGVHPTQARQTAAPPELRIVRRGPGGILFFFAEETTPLMPGDVLRVGTAEPAAQSAAIPVHP